MEISEEIRIQTAATENFNTDYFSFGRGKRSLVILPGLSVQSVMGAAKEIAAAYRNIAEEFTVYVFDRRKELSEKYSVCEMARDTAAAIRAAGIERTAVFGASQGGMIALEIAANYPELVEKLALGCTAARVTDKAYAVIEKWIRFAEKGDAEGLYTAFAKTVYPKDVFEKSRRAIEEAAKTVKAEDLKRFIILGRTIKDFDATKELEKIVCPVFATGDTDDRVFGADAAETIREYAKNALNFDLYIYDGYGHAAYDTAPDYKERLLKFLR